MELFGPKGIIQDPPLWLSIASRASAHPSDSLLSWEAVAAGARKPICHMAFRASSAVGSSRGKCGTAGADCGLGSTIRRQHLCPPARQLDGFSTSCRPSRNKCRRIYGEPSGTRTPDTLIKSVTEGVTYFRRVFCRRSTSRDGRLTIYRAWSGSEEMRLRRRG